MNCSLFTILSLVYDSGMWMDVVWDRGGWRGEKEQEDGGQSLRPA